MTSCESVSYIYFPDGSFLWGHSELEVNGTAHSLIFSLGNVFKVHFEKPFQKLIDSTTSGKGYQFVRFVFKIPPSRLNRISDNLGNTTHFNCAHGALSSLQKITGYRVPCPFNKTPALSARYLLQRVNQLKDPAIERVEFYQPPNHMLNAINRIKGIVGECIFVACILIAKVFVVAYIAACVLDFKLIDSSANSALS